MKQGGYSSAGRALAWHARGQRFDPAYLHQVAKKNSWAVSGRAAGSGSKKYRAKATISSWSPSSRGLGHHPFTVSTGVRIPLGTPRFLAASGSVKQYRSGCQIGIQDRFLSPSSRGLGHHPFTVSTGVRIPLGTPGLSCGIG